MKLYTLALASTLLVACATTKPASTTSVTSANAPVAPRPAANAETKCDLVCGTPEVVARPIDMPDYHRDAVADARRVVDGMHDDLLACYTKRLADNPRAEGYVSIDVVIAPDGKPMNVETIGGYKLGESVRRCLTNRIERASFAPVHGGGTLHVRIPLTFRRLAPGETFDETF